MIKNTKEVPHLRSIASQNITKQYLYNFDPLNPTFIEQTGVYRGIHYFSYFCSETYTSAHKHRLCVLVRTASARRFLRVHTIYVCKQKYEKYQIFYLKTLSLVVKLSMYLIVFVLSMYLIVFVFSMYLIVFILSMYLIVFVLSMYLIVFVLSMYLNRHVFVMRRHTDQTI